MIIELRKYNKIRELLIENRTTGSQVHVSYQDGGQEASVTRVAVHMGVKRWGCEQGTGVHESASESGSRPGMCAGTVEQLRSVSIL